MFYVGAADAAKWLNQPGLSIEHEEETLMNIGASASHVILQRARKGGVSASA
jgi:hypothetical protein